MPIGHFCPFVSRHETVTRKSLLKMNTTATERPAYNYTASSFPPDTETLRIAAIVTLCLNTVWTLALMIFVFLRRNKQPVKVRAPPLLISHLFVLWLLVTIFALRIVVGRVNFPCFVYMIVYYVAAPEVAIPTLLRCYRFILVFKLSRYSAQVKDRIRSTKLLKAMKVLVSYKVLALLGLTFLVVHACCAFLFTGILTATGPENLYSANGCNSGNNVYFTATVLVIYAAVVIIMFFIIAKDWKEPYLIRIEMVCSAISATVFMVPFLVANFNYDYVSPIYDD